MSCILETISGEAFASDALRILADFIPYEKKGSSPERYFLEFSTSKPLVLYRQAQGSREEMEMAHSFPLIPI